MTAPSLAKLAFLTEPEPGVYLLNLRAEGGEFYRLRISKGHLENFVMDGSRIAFRKFGVLRPVNPDPPRDDVGGIAMRGGL